jgi:hypothetical protein
LVVCAFGRFLVFVTKLFELGSFQPLPPP